MTDLELVKRVLQDVIEAAHRIDGIEYNGKPVYEIEHTSLNDLLQWYRTHGVPA